VTFTFEEEFLICKIWKIQIKATGNYSAEYMIGAMVQGRRRIHSKQKRTDLYYLGVDWAIDDDGPAELDFFKDAWAPKSCSTSQ